MSFGQVDNINIVADAGTVRRVVVIAKDGQLLSDADSCLRDVGNEVGWYSIG